MTLFGKGSPRIYPHCFDRQPPLFTICLGSPHDFLWQRQPPYLSTLFQQVAPVVSNLLREPPWLYLTKVAPAFIHIVAISSPHCLQLAQEAPMALFGKGSPRLYPHCFDRQSPLFTICLGTPIALYDQVSPRLYPHCFDRQPPLFTICLGSPHIYPHCFNRQPLSFTICLGSPHGFI